MTLFDRREVVCVVKVWRWTLWGGRGEQSLYSLPHTCVSRTVLAKIPVTCVEPLSPTISHWLRLTSQRYAEDTRGFSQHLCLQHPDAFTIARR